LNIFIYWQVTNYLQSCTLFIRYNYLLAFIYKLTFIYKLPFTSAKAIIIPTNNLQLCFTPINTRFHQILKYICSHLELTHTCSHTHILAYFSKLIFLLEHQNHLFCMSHILSSWQRHLSKLVCEVQEPISASSPLTVLAPDFGKNTYIIDVLRSMINVYM